MGIVTGAGEEAARLAVRAAWREAGLGPGARVVVAVSGGPDSTALLRTLAAMRPELGLDGLWVAYFDHGWRDVEAEKAFVRDIARELRLPASFGYAGRGATGEAAARAARRAFLLGVARAVGAQAVALGHTADDQAETVLLQLLRGTWIGLRAMAPWRAPFLRPFLGLRRRLVHTLVADLPVAADPTNRQPRLARSRVRRFLEEEAAWGRDPVPVLARLAALVADEEAYWAEELPFAELVRAEPFGAVLEVGRLVDLPLPVQRRVLRRLFETLGWEATSARVERLRRSLAAEGVPGGLPARFVAVRGRGGEVAFLSRRPPSEAEAVRVRGPARLLLPRPAPAEIRGWSAAAPELPFDVRYYERGVRLRYRGRRLEAADLPVAPWHRSEVPLLCVGDRCLVVVGAERRGPAGRMAVAVSPDGRSLLVGPEALVVGRKTRVLE